MGFYPGRYGDGAGASTLTKLSTVLSTTATDHLQISVRADPNNSGVVYIGGSNLTTAGVGAGVALKAGESFVFGPKPFRADITKIYLIGSDTNQIAYCNDLTDEQAASSRRR